MKKRQLREYQIYKSSFINYPSWELTYPIQRQLERWVSFRICFLVLWRVPQVVLYHRFLSLHQQVCWVGFCAWTGPVDLIRVEIMNCCIFICYTSMWQEVSTWMGYNLVIHEVYWGYNNPLTNHLLICWDIQVLIQTHSFRMILLRTLVAGNHSGKGAGGFAWDLHEGQAWPKKKLNNHHMKSPCCLHGFLSKLWPLKTESLKLTASLVLKIEIISWTMIRMSVWGNSHLGPGHLFSCVFWFLSVESSLQNDHQVEPPTPPTGQMRQIPPCHLGDFKLGFVTFCRKNTIWEIFLFLKRFSKHLNKTERDSPHIVHLGCNGDKWRFSSRFPNLNMSYDSGAEEPASSVAGKPKT